MAEGFFVCVGNYGKVNGLGGYAWVAVYMDTEILKMDDLKNG